MSAKGFLVKVGLSGTLVVGAFVGANCLKKVKPGYAGIVYSLSGGVEDAVLTQGMHFVSPFKKVTQYSIATEQGYLSADKKEGDKGDSSFMIPTSDGKTVRVSLEYSYHFDAERLPETYSQFKGQSGKEIEETFMRGKLKTYAGEVSSTFMVMDIYGSKRTELNAAILEYAREKFDTYGIIIDSINITDIELDAATATAIQDKVNKQNELEALKIEKEKAEIENQKNIDKASAEAEQKKIKAEAEAQATLIEAEAQAEANRLLSESLTDKLLEQQKYEVWDGTLPQVTGGSTPIIDLK